MHEIFENVLVLEEKGKIFPQIIPYSNFIDTVSIYC